MFCDCDPRQCCGKSDSSATLKKQTSERKMGEKWKHTVFLSRSWFTICGYLINQQPINNQFVSQSVNRSTPIDNAAIQNEHFYTKK